MLRGRWKKVLRGKKALQCKTGFYKFSKSRSELKILEVRRETQSGGNTEEPQILCDTVQSFVAMAIWRQGFVHT